MSLTSSPRLVKGGLVILAPGGGAVQRMVSLQYNPDSLERAATRCRASAATAAASARSRSA